MRRKTEKKIEARLSDCGKAAPWKSPQYGLSHLAWKSAKPADSHFSTATTATDGLFIRAAREPKNQTPDSSEINLLQQKNGLDYGVHRRPRNFPEMCKECAVSKQGHARKRALQRRINSLDVIAGSFTSCYHSKPRG